MHPKDKRRRRSGGGGVGSSSTSSAVGGRKSKIFWAYVEKNGKPKSMRPSSYVDIGFKNVQQWTRHKRAHGYVSDSGFVTFLLGLLEQLQPTILLDKIPDADKISDEASSAMNGVVDIRGSTESLVEVIYAGTENADNSDGHNLSIGHVDMIVKKEPGLEDSDEESESADAAYDYKGYTDTKDSDFSMDEDGSFNESGESMSDSDSDFESTGSMEGTALKNESKETKSKNSPKIKSKRSPYVKKPKEKKAKKSKCIDCNDKHPAGECPLMRPVKVVVDTPIDHDVDLRSFADCTLPNMLKLDTIEEQHGLSVLAGENISQYTQFGPLIGTRVNEPDIHEHTDLKHIWEVFGSTSKSYIDTFNENASNWLRHMRPATSQTDMNVSIIVKEDELYFVTTQDIKTGTELVYWVEDPLWLSTNEPALKTNCYPCKKWFSNPLYYRMHCVIFHDPNCSRNKRKFRCKICGLILIGRKTLRLHASEMHDGKGAYQCDYCKKYFTRRNCKESHLTYHCKLNPDRNRPLCDICGKDFSKPYKLKVHMRRMHSDNMDALKEFQCDQCSKLMSSRTCLQRHMNEVHAMNEVATCDRCGKTFQNRSNLKIHMLTHSGLKPFRCAEIHCNAAFTTKQCLQFHYKKLHGYTMENMPAIERSVAYTFENYAGGEETADKTS